MNTRRVFVAGAVVLGIAVLGWSLSTSRPDTCDDLLLAAREAFDAGDVEQARKLTEAAYELDGQRTDVLLTLSGLLWEQGERHAAVTRLMAVDNGVSDASSVLSRAAEMCLELERLEDAEACLRRVLILESDNIDARNRLARLLGVAGRSWEMQQQLYRLVESGHAVRDHLLMLSVAEPVIRDEQLISRVAERRPVSIVMLGRARTAVFENRSAEVIPLLQRLVTARPDVGMAWAVLGKALLDADDRHVDEWSQQLPDQALEHPDVRVVLALWMDRQNRPESAIAHLVAALRLNPDHRVANYQLGLQLQKSGESEQAEKFLERAKTLQRLETAADRIYSQQRVFGEMRVVVEQLERLGRVYEADAWCRIVLEQRPHLTWAVQTRNRLQPILAGTPPRSRALPLPDVSEHVDVVQRPDDVSTVHTGSTPGAIRFVEEAAERGIAFEFRTGDEPPGTPRMHESFGGGVGVLDYDGDLRPDLYFTQGTSWSQRIGGGALDAVFRNTGKGFTDVTAVCGIRESTLSTGIAAGDIDSDGFPDLYVAGIGRNRLFLNNGDGTFSEVDPWPEATPEAWTSSCLIADLNDDGLADLYDANYLEFPDAPATLCRHGDEEALCGPGAFEAAQDQLWLNSGDGTFRNVTSDAGIEIPHGKGLGIIAGQLDGEPGLDLFVANDAEPNGLFLNRTQSPAKVRFVEEALLRGAAVDREGATQACMGIAAGDADADGQLDLFITNFADESAVFYRQNKGLFEDATQQVGLRTPTFGPLGFGTQFLDADLDGWLDIVAVNGHVHDLSDRGGEYAMRPQLFQNQGGAEFIERPDAGDWFGQRVIGRALARLDWNGDGRNDLVVSNINAPAALLTNRTETPGSFIAICLIGTHTHRDAIGATVTVRDDDRHWTAQLLAGDGFQSSNQRRLIIGLPGAPESVDVEIRWNDGNRQSHRDIPAGSVVTCVEGGGAFPRD